SCGKYWSRGLWVPMRWCNLAGLDVFTNPSACLGRPLSNVIGSARVIFESEDGAISRYGLNRLANQESPPDGLSGNSSHLFESDSNGALSDWLISWARPLDGFMISNQVSVCPIVNTRN